MLELGAVIVAADGRIHRFIATRSDGKVVTVTREQYEAAAAIYVDYEQIPESPSPWQKTPVGQTETYCREMGCRQKVKARGLCAAHYKQAWRRATGKH